MPEFKPALKWSLLLAVLQIALTVSETSAAQVGNTWQKDLALGQTQIDEQKLPEAEQSFRRAVQAVEQSHATPDDLAKCYSRLGDALALRRQTGKAQGFYRKALTTQEKAYGANSPKVVPSLFALGSLFESEGDPTTAMALYQRAFKISEKHYGPYSPNVAHSLQRLGRATYHAGNKQEGERHYKTALSILLREPGLSASDQLQSLMKDYSDTLKEDKSETNQGLSKDFQSDFSNQQATPKIADSGSSLSSDGIQTTSPDGLKPALRDSEPALDSASNKQSSITHPITDEGSTAVASAISSPNPTDDFSNASTGLPQTKSDSSYWQKQNTFRLHTSADSQTDMAPEVVLRGMNLPFQGKSLTPAYSTMNDSIFKQSHFGKDEGDYQRMIAIDIKSLGPNNPAVGNDLIGLSLYYLSSEKYKEAQPLLMKALSIYEQTYGQNNILTIRTRTLLASTVFHLGMPEEAASLYREALGHGEEGLGPNNLETARILNELAYLYYHQGKLEEACTFYQWALASTRAALGDNDPLVAACMRDYARVLRSLGRNDEANSVEVKAAGILAAAAG
jgi:tetratricopeptide (TPR) repeat protein